MVVQSMSISARWSCPGPSGSESVFLRMLFEEFDRHDIAYAVMRNHEPLPNSVGTSDLDLLVGRQCEHAVRKVIDQAIKEVGAVPVGHASTAGFFKVYILGSPIPPFRNWWGLRVDVNVGLLFKGAPIIGDIDPRVLGTHNGISVLPDGLAAVLGVVKDALHNGRLPARYLSSAKEAAENSWEIVRRTLEPAGPAGIALLRRLIVQEVPCMDVRCCCADLRRRIIGHALRRNPLRVIGCRIRFEWSKVRRFLRPCGMFLAILGVDGAGKSTLITEISPILREATHNALFIQHLRPSLLPPLGQFKNRKNTREPLQDPHGPRPSGPVGSLFRLIYHTLDYVLGYWVKVRPKIARQPAVVLFDRYAYDMALDPRRFRVGLSGMVTGWFAALSPKPDLILCLHAAPETVAVRKQELSLGEIRRQIEALHAFARKERRAVLISAEGQVSELRDRALQAIFNFLSNRWDRNWSDSEGGQC